MQKNSFFFKTSLPVLLRTDHLTSDGRGGGGGGGRGGGGERKIWSVKDFSFPLTNKADICFSPRVMHLPSPPETSHGLPLCIRHNLKCFKQSGHKTRVLKSGSMSLQSKAALHLQFLCSVECVCCDTPSPNLLP